MIHCPKCEREMGCKENNFLNFEEFKIFIKDGFPSAFHLHICEHCQFSLGIRRGSQLWSVWGWSDQDRTDWFNNLSSLEECLESVKRKERLRAFE